MARIEDVRVKQEAGFYRASDESSFTIVSTEENVALDLLKVQAEKKDEGIWKFIQPELVLTNERHG